MVSLQRIAAAFPTPFRAALVALFVLISAMQPAAFAHGGADLDLLNARADQTSDSAEKHIHGPKLAADEHGSVNKSAGHSHEPSDKNCQVHCAPCQAVPQDYPLFAPVLSQCFIVATDAIMQPGELASILRPPRS
jgi:hypothetical protein